MDNKLIQFFKSMKDISLKVDEKSLMKADIVSFMDKNELPYSAGNKIEVRQPIKSSYIRSTLIIFKKPMTALIIGLLLLGSGATSFAAEQTVPGDALYPVKISVNEKVIDALKVSDESKANWEARKAERRVEEIAEIIKKKKVANKDAVVAQLEKQFDEHTVKVDELIAKLENAGDIDKALEVSKRFEDILNSQEDILRVISDNQANSDETEERVLNHVGDTTENIAQKREDNEENIADKTENGFQEVASEKTQDLKEQIAEIENYINDVKQKVGAPVTAEAIKKLDEAKLLVANSEDKLSAKKYKEAFGISKEARKVAHEAERIINKWQLFEVRNVNLNKDRKVDFEDFKKQVKEEDEFKKEIENEAKIEKENKKERLEKSIENEKEKVKKEIENEKERLEKDREDKKKRLEKDRESDNNKPETVEKTDGQKDKENGDN